MQTVHEQRLEALRIATESRVYTAARRREVTQGTLSFRSLLEDERCGSMPVSRALLALPWVGRRKAEWVLNRSRVMPAARLGSLTDRQKTTLVGYLEHYPSQRGSCV